MKRLVLFLLIFGTFAFAEDYQIKLQRAAKVGEKYSVQVQAHTYTKIKSESQGTIIQDRTEEYDLTFSGLLTVVQIDQRQAATKISISTDQFTKTQAGASALLLEKGDKIDAWKNAGKMIILVNGNTPSPDLSKVLKTVLSVHEEGRPVDDDIFGNTNRVKVGASWGVNNKAAAADLQANGIEIQEEDLRGTVKLNGIVEDDGQKCMDLSGTMSITKFKIPLPPGVTTTASAMTVNFQGKFPLNPYSSNIWEKEDMSMSFSGTGVQNANGKQIPLNVTVETKQSRTSRTKKM